MWVCLSALKAFTIQLLLLVCVCGLPPTNTSLDTHPIVLLDRPPALREVRAETLGPGGEEIAVTIPRYELAAPKKAPA